MDSGVDVDAGAAPYGYGRIFCRTDAPHRQGAGPQQRVWHPP